MRFRPTRRMLVIAGIVFSTLAVLVLVGLYVVYPRLGKWMIENKVVPKLEAKLGRDVKVGAIDVDHGRAVLTDIEIRGPNDREAPLAHIDRIEVEFDFWASLVARPEVGLVVIDGVTVRAHRDADGIDNFRDLLQRLGLVEGGEDEGEAAQHRLGSLRPTRIELRGGTVEMIDEGTRVTVTIDDFDGAWNRGGRAVVNMRGARAATTFGPEAAATTLTAIDDPVEGRRVDVSGGMVTLWSGMALTGIAGSVAPHPDGSHRFDVDFEGGYGGVEGRLWTAAGAIDPDARQMSLDLDAERFHLDRLRPILERSPMLDYEKASVDARFHVDVSEQAASFDGGFHLRDFTVSHPLFADRAVPALEIGGDITGHFDRASRTLSVEKASLSTRGLPFQVSGWLAMPGGLDATGVRRPRPALDVRFVLPPRPCQEVLEAIPPELVPYLNEFVLTGDFHTDLRIAIDWTKLKQTVLTGSVGLFKCKGKKAPSDVARLRGQFEHYVEVTRNNWVSFVVGPANPDFVPIEDVSPYLKKSLMTTEDSSFPRHRGFIVKEFKSALIKNLEAGYFRYGASSITMQMVKNVLLYREKTAARKLQELFLTWYVETVLSKDRILEIYVNVIEYGPALYGIGPAAQHYFGKHPRDLNPVESAFFSSILPNPKERYAQFCKGTLRRQTEAKIQRILGIMLKRHRLTQEEYDLAVATPLAFARDPGDSEDDCMGRRSRAMRRSRPTNPLKK